jgi:hypothetical protein
MEKNAARERMFPHPAMARPDKIRIGNTWSQSTRQPQELSLIDVLPSVIPSTPTPQHISADPGQCKGERVREKSDASNANNASNASSNNNNNNNNEERNDNANANASTWATVGPT